MKIMGREETLEATLAALSAEHKRLDQEVAQLATSPIAPSLELQRLKRRKLALKDRMMVLRDRLNPDIIA
jgi:hypothetical protein